MDQVIEIKETQYGLKFGYGALRALGSFWKLPGPAEVGEKISNAFASGDTQTLTFEQMDVVGAMVWSAIVAKDTTLQSDITPDDCATAVMENPEAFMQVITWYGESLPKGETAGKPKAGAATRQKKK